MEKKGTFVLAAGGTGGHLFPAQALAEELIRRGYDTHLMTDERVRDYGKSFPAAETHIVPSATLSLSKPWLVPGRALRLYGGYRKARAILARVKPLAVIGFGGYPSFPPIMAAARLKIPSCVHDQNAVMGRANRVLAKWADAVASSFPNLQGLPAGAEKKLTITGNPVRDIALKQKAAPYPPFDTFNLLVFGGSQGAQFFGEFMPKAFAAMSAAERAGIKLTQQVRTENMEAVSRAYREMELDCELNPFFMDMPKRIAESHLVVCRSGASTIAELGVIGRPAIMVPLPHALDNDQLRNAESFAAAGAGWVHPQASLSPHGLAQILTSLRSQQRQLQLAAAAALSHGKPDAAERLADLAEKLAGKLTP
jgi:UDP-N-acetylglucosamine--N-acetylmuramyl-(pentapeptide) pyrophosphoryl-undecaprenol N-acetylglucosamine transferase